MYIVLLGHELPYAIRMNNYRTLHEYTHDENDNQYEQTAAIDNDGKLQFVLKKVKKGGSRTNMGKVIFTPKDFFFNLYHIKRLF